MRVDEVAGLPITGGFVLRPAQTGTPPPPPTPPRAAPPVRRTQPPVCYRASWQLPGPDFHRQATTSLRLSINLLHDQPPVGWAHGNGSMPLLVGHSSRQFRVLVSYVPDAM